MYFLFAVIAQGRVSFFFFIFPLFFYFFFFSLAFKSVFRGAGDFIPVWFYLLSVCFVLMV